MTFLLVEELGRQHLSSTLKMKAKHGEQLKLWRRLV